MKIMVLSINRLCHEESRGYIPYFAVGKDMVTCFCHDIIGLPAGKVLQRSPFRCDFKTHQRIVYAPSSYVSPISHIQHEGREKKKIRCNNRTSLITYFLDSVHEAPHYQGHWLSDKVEMLLATITAQPSTKDDTSKIQEDIENPLTGSVD